MPLFSEVYDAQQTLKSKKEMTMIACNTLEQNDVVLIEASIARWPRMSKKDGKSVSYSEQEWKKWQAEFRMHSVSLILKAPELDIVKDFGEDVSI